MDHDNAGSYPPRRLRNRNDAGRRLRLLAVVLAAAVAAASYSNGARSEETPIDDARFGNICSATATTGHRACLDETTAERWVQIGACLNLSDPVQQRACLEKADAGRTERNELCAEQHLVRLNLCGVLGEAGYEPDVTALLVGSETLPMFVAASFPENPAQTADSANPYFPLVPGRAWFYEKLDRAGEIIQQISVRVGREVKNIGGVNCLTVYDVVRTGDSDEVPPLQETDGWFAQDNDGNVWHCGEVAQHFEQFDPDSQPELVDLDGSWKGFRDFARPGIVMLANPMIGDVYRQQFAPGDAEDVAQVTSVSGSELVPAALCIATCVVTLEFSALEPGAFTSKHYAPEVGLILAVDMETGERTELVMLSR